MPHDRSKAMTDTTDDAVELAARMDAAARGMTMREWAVDYLAAEGVVIVPADLVAEITALGKASARGEPVSAAQIDDVIERVAALPGYAMNAARTVN
jgi:hypothetical protein